MDIGVRIINPFDDFTANPRSHSFIPQEPGRSDLLGSIPYASLRGGFYNFARGKDLTASSEPVEFTLQNAVQC